MLAVLVAITGFIVWFLLEDRVRIQREAERMTRRYGVLLVGTDSRYAPMGYFRAYGITPRDFNIAMGSEIAARLGIRAAIITTSWDRIFDELDIGLYDIIISSVIITPERQAAYNFSRPYIANPLVMVTLKDSPIAALSPIDVTGLNVAFQANTNADFFIERLTAREGLQHILHRHDQVQYSFEELEQGQVDAVITDLLVARSFVAPADNPFEIVWKNPEPTFFGIAIGKGNDRLTEAINQILEDMFNDGTMLRISMDKLGMDFVTQSRQAW